MYFAPDSAWHVTLVPHACKPCENCCFCRILEAIFPQRPSAACASHIPKSGPAGLICTMEPASSFVLWHISFPVTGSVAHTWTSLIYAEQLGQQVGTKRFLIDREWHAPQENSQALMSPQLSHGRYKHGRHRISWRSFVEKSKTPTAKGEAPIKQVSNVSRFGISRVECVNGKENR